MSQKDIDEMLDNIVKWALKSKGKHTPAERDQYLQYINNLTYNIRIEEGNK